jgi:hypothetical protein
MKNKKKYKIEEQAGADLAKVRLTWLRWLELQIYNFKLFASS